MPAVVSHVVPVGQHPRAVMSGNPPVSVRFQQHRTSPLGPGEQHCPPTNSPPLSDRQQWLLSPHGKLSVGSQVGPGMGWDPHLPLTQLSPAAQHTGLALVPHRCAFGQQVVPISVVSLGHSHLQVVRLTTSPVLLQVTHWFPAGHSVLPVGQPQILPLPCGFLIQRREQHWVLAVHLRKGCLHAAQAAPGMEAKVPPTKAAPSIRSALPRERVPVASPLARSSMELGATSVGVFSERWSLWSSAASLPMSPCSSAHRRWFYVNLR
jgi:hypothetical protein